VNRRAFVTGLGAVLAAPLGAEAQQPGKVYRIGFLRAGPPPETYLEAFGRACWNGDMSMAEM
jgi:hypothetical protein